MSISPGTRIGPYDVIAPLGAGGMGEVYRARDPRLGRDVALKVLPESFVGDAARMARFQREAQLLASLKHPNIAAIYGLEEGHALVLELVEGQTLAARIAAGPLPLEDALPVARQIAEALEAAHEQGIVHRDLKPENIRLTPDGVVKVLDFGLARMAGPVDAGPHDRSPTDAGSGISASSPSESPTAVTGAGMILGTAAYMAPEQARGRPTDRRGDIWAFGCVLYEMLTGVSPFKGDDTSETLAFILTREPDWAALPAATPAPIRRLLRRTLVKDRRHRLADAGDARLEIDDALSAPASEPLAPAVRTDARWHRSAVLGTVVIAALAAAAVTWMTIRSDPPRVSRLMLAAPNTITAGGEGRSVAITPDGRRVIYTAQGQLMVRALDQLDGVPVSGVSFPTQPFVSPDGAWIGVFEGLALRKVPIAGGAPLTLATLDGPAARGGTWGPDNTIVFASDNAATGLRRVSADGGEVTALTTPDRERGEGDHVWPQALPGGIVLFTIVPATPQGEPQIAAYDLGSGATTVVLRGGSHGRYVASGHLVYLAGTTLQAVPFDPDGLQVSGAPVQVLPQIRTTASGAADFDVSADGTLVYVVGETPPPAPRTVVWVDRDGNETPVNAPPRRYERMSLSPDGTRVAFEIGDEEYDVWVFDLTRPELPLVRLTFDPWRDWRPVWTPDGRRIIFGSARAGATNLFAQAADGTGSPERLTEAPYDQLPTSVSPDGRNVVIYENPETLDIAMLPLDGASRPRALVAGPGNQSAAQVSPDGEWLAYQSNESGQNEVYVRPFPDVDGGRWQVSSGGGAAPLWSRAGDELFYQRGGAVLGVQVQIEETWGARAPEVIVEGPYVAGGAAPAYAVAPDAQQFLMLKQAAATAPPSAPPAAVVVLHWFEELRRLAP